MNLLDDILVRSAFLLAGILAGVQGTLIVQRRRVAALRPYWVQRLRAITSHYRAAWSGDALSSHAAELDAMSAGITDMLVVGARPQAGWRALAADVAELRTCVHHASSLPVGDELLASLAAVRNAAQQVATRLARLAS